MIAGVSITTLLLVLAAGIGAGFVGYAVGASSLISYPALLAFGIPPVLSNTTNTVGVCGTGIGGLLSARKELKGQGRRVAVYACIGLVGGIIGGLLLLELPAKVFEFAVPPLRALVRSGYNVVGVVTTPDKPAGRGQKLHESDVKIAARELGLPILQPEKLRDPAFVSTMEELRPDLGIVIAFRMLPEVVWAMPRLGTFNLHASLLPQYRGAAPINWAIINGESKTGVTTFLLNHEIDKGAILGQVEMPIQPEDNVGTLYDRLMTVGADLVVQTVERIAAGEITPVVQPDEDASLQPAPKIFKNDCLIDWTQSGKHIIDFIRGLSPYPAAWTRLLREEQEANSAKIFEAHFETGGPEAPCGTIDTDNRKYLRIRCADGWIDVLSLQLSGKKRMAAQELLLGFRDANSYVCR